ncbi:MAG: prepilin-type N-terminal cleavage/methylation domain-containing protein [Chthoniobacterales bacterium]|nr:prepilin-type N-terminal cleavage/methylation domain-containing protein [Chthoniobacterales bacterium]
MIERDISAVPSRRSTGFTLVEVLVSVSLLALVVLLVAKLTDHATAILARAANTSTPTHRRGQC